MNNYSKAGLGKLLRAGLVGYTGYSGAELAGLLQRHPAAELLLLDHRKANEGTADTRPVACGPDGATPLPHVAWEAGAVRANKLDVVFTATPPEVSQELIPEILNQGARAIDLSGAFRLPTAAEYQRWYGAAHTHPELLPQAVYGLPELYRENIRAACLVANPGCYPTAAICALWPLLNNDLVDRTAGVICDAKSGVTGAGKNPSPKTHFVQVSENFSAYAILKHRHVPEVLLNAGIDESDFAFTAHLLPTQRGILATHYVRLRQPMQLDAVYEVYRTAYAKARFIRLYPAGSTPQLAAVNGTNFCDLHCTLAEDGRRLVVVSCIDNLVKGAAGQAVQNMNVMFGLDEAAGLLP
ncbi:MAG: N-acetyl-gamma-glutamyl-phosphate reductase [Acidobacteria bacterium RIFCSPLOWO2_02_FULL_60_20]|nr:MAG: N-acetyl-gamma-glutamyl-phosphate reductase [Acidobacteria bacterium RIFCSPLOWO2_02_FULL_60_20]